MARMSFATAIGLGCIAVQTAGQVPGTLDHPTGAVVPYVLDGFATDTVHIESASWLRLYFDRVELAPGSFLRMTSVLDGEVQELDAAGLSSWGNTSAYFNGDTVLVELVAADAGAGNRVSLRFHAAVSVPELPHCSSHRGLARTRRSSFSLPIVLR